MKEGNDYVVKSERLAVAQMKRRMTYAQDQNEKQTRRRRIRKRPTSRKMGHRYLLKAVADATQGSCVKIQLIEKRDGSSRTRSMRTEDDAQRPHVHGKVNVAHMNTLSLKLQPNEGPKRTKIVEIVEDGRPFTEQEVQYFEEKYEEVLFDNTINVSEAHQADLGTLGQRKFNSYRNGDKRLQLNRRSLEFKNKVLYATETLNSKGKHAFTHSQIHALSNICGTVECFKSILSADRRLVRCFFESMRSPKLRQTLR